MRGGVQQHHERAENHRADLQQEQRTARNRFGILHREALGHESSQTERQVGKKERNQDDAEDVQHARVDASPGRKNRSSQSRCKLRRRQR